MLRFSRVFSVAAVSLLGSTLVAQTGGSPGADLDGVLRRMGEYIAGYGEKAALIVALETYTQEATGQPGRRPRHLEAEFALVRTPTGWVGFRDVISVNGDEVEDRRDRLLRALTDSKDALGEAARIANESARYNIGPIARNFNVPTAALFFFRPGNLERFAFKRKGSDRIAGIDTWGIEFKETRRPTLVMTRSGRDVPCDGTLWVSPTDGAVVRTLMRLRNFADMSAMSSGTVEPPRMRPPVNPNTPTGGMEAIQQSQSIDIRGGKMESAAEVEVSYRWQPSLGLWLPYEMTERYAGPVQTGTRTPAMTYVTTRAKYSQFKRFETSATVKVK